MPRQVEDMKKDDARRRARGFAFSCPPVKGGVGGVGFIPDKGVGFVADRPLCLSEPSVPVLTKDNHEGRADTQSDIYV